jgi:hypothetical protein
MVIYKVPFNQENVQGIYQGEWRKAKVFWNLIEGLVHNVS